MSGRPAVLLLTPSARETARRVRDALDGAELLAPAGRAESTDTEFSSFAEQARALYRAGRPIVGLCAAGVLVRVLAPLLADKRAEPPVIAVAEDGSAVVPLLGGHRGANELARRVANSLGVAAAITTASELRFGVALDDPPPGWRLADPAAVKPFTAALLAGATLRVDGQAPWLSDGELPIQDVADLAIHVSRGEVAAGGPGRLVYHPAVLAIGVGCERGAEPDEVVGLLRRTLAEAGLAEAAVAAVFSIDLKADEPAVHGAAAALDVEARFFDAATLEAETPRLVNPSETVFREVGAHGVAEAAALAAAGDQGELIVPKTKSRRATAAVARAPNIIDPAAAGRPRGNLAVVGIGPGRADWRTPEADAALAAADDLVGYGLYLDLAGGAGPGQTRHDYGLGQEQRRVRVALDLAATGRRVALVCSGDAGIYAMAALVFEELREPPVTIGAASPSRWCPASPPCRPPPPAPARRSATISAPCRCPTC